MFSTFEAALNRLLESLRIQNNESTYIRFEQMLKLLGQSIEHKEGKLVQQPALIIMVQQLAKLLSEPEMPENIILIICKLVILLLLSKNIHLSQEQASLLIRKVLVVPQKTVFTYFVDNVSEYGSFEALILPSFLKYCVETDLNAQCLQLLTKLLMKKAPLCGNGIKLLEWKQYTLNFGNVSTNDKILNILMDKINNTESIADYFCALICLPHLNTPNTNDIINILDTNTSLLINKLQNCNDLSLNIMETKKILFLLYNTLECLIHLGGSNVLLNKFSNICDCLLRFSINTNFIISLRIISLLVSALKEEQSIITMENLLKIHDTMKGNFSSPFHEVNYYLLSMLREIVFVVQYCVFSGTINRILLKFHSLLNTGASFNFTHLYIV